MLRKANWDKTLQKSLKFSNCRKSIRKQIRPSCGKNLTISFCACLVSWKQGNSDIRANIPKSCRRPVVSLLYATKSALTAPNMLGMRTCLPCHIPDRWSRNANWIWPDLAFGFVLKRSGNEINKTLQKLLKFSFCRESIRKQIRPSCRKTFRSHFVFVWFLESNEI